MNLIQSFLALNCLFIVMCEHWDNKSIRTIDCTASSVHTKKLVSMWSGFNLFNKLYNWTNYVV